MRVKILAGTLLFSLLAMAQAPAPALPGQTVTSLSAATATGAGSAFQIKFIQPGAYPPNKFTWTCVVTGTPDATVINLEGSNDVQLRSDGVATASSATFTSATGGFSAADIGKEITIVGAGAAGATKVTTITAVASATSITLGSAATTSVSGATYRTARWFTLDSSTTVTNEMRHVVNKPVLWIRANLATLTNGTSPTVTAVIMPAAQ